MKPKDSVWKYKSKEVKEIPEGMQGFIYQIIHTETGKSYIGKKQFFNTLNVKVSKKRSDILYSGKGRKPTREKKINESNWKVYTSSSKELNDDIEKYGITAFKFIILESWWW